MQRSFKRSNLRDRLSGYWRLELANAVLLPAGMVFLVHTADSHIGWLSWCAFVPMCALLLVGGLYWRGKLKALGRRQAELVGALKLAGTLQGALLAASVGAFGAALASWAVPSLSVSLADRTIATVSATLAVLEYVNYYHRQLQHFDHGADFRRLVRGAGFRRSQMSVDLARYRAGKMR